MPKILQVSTRHNVGGISKLIIELLGDSNFEQVYATGRCENNEKEYSLQLTSPAADTYTFERIRSLKRSIHFTDDVLALLALIKIIRKERPDIIHTHMSKAGLLGRIAALVSLRKIRIVHSYHGHVLDGYFNKLFTKIVVNLEKILGRFTHAFVFDGGNTQIEVNNYGIKPKKVQQVILPGLIKKVLDNRQNRANNESLQILVVARIERVKRIDLILSVARSLMTNHPLLPFDVTIVGDGELRKSLEDLCKRELLPIKFIGWTDTVGKYYQEADILLSTSDSEGTPLTFMEAASYGCPIISTNVGSVVDLIDDGHTGILCTNNPIEIASEISRLWFEPGLLNKLSHNSIAKASEEFTLDKFIQKHSNLYKSLLA
jgi:glycosyltransferase involved in cell wall biosynthesis